MPTGVQFRLQGLRQQAYSSQAQAPLAHFQLLPGDYLQGATLLPMTDVGFGTTKRRLRKMQRAGRSRGASTKKQMVSRRSEAHVPHTCLTAVLRLEDQTWIWLCKARRHLLLESVAMKALNERRVLHPGCHGSPKKRNGQTGKPF